MKYMSKATLVQYKESILPSAGFLENRKQLKFVYSMYILNLFFKSSSSNFAFNSTYYLVTDRIHTDRDYSVLTLTS